METSYYKLVPVFIILELVTSLVSHTFQHDCLTWERSTETVTLTCKITDLLDAVVFRSPGGTEVARCTPQGHLSNCTSWIPGNTIFQNLESNETIYKVHLYGSEDVHGSWECKHNSTSIRTNVSSGGEMKSAVDVEITGNVSVVEQSYIFTLSCYSCSNPYQKYVEFQVNDRTEDYVIFTENRCYHNNGECSQTDCSCSKISNLYTWTFRKKQPVLPMKVSCSMLFLDFTTFKRYRKYGVAVFNGEEFTYIKTKPIIITEKEEEKTVERSRNNAVPIGLVTVSVLVFAAMILGIKHKRPRKCIFRAFFSRRVRRGECDEDLPLIDDDKDMLGNLNISPTCTMCQVLTTHAFCSYGKVFVCETCSGYYRSSCNYNLVQIANMYPGKNTRCFKCEGLNPERICIICKEISCTKCKFECEHTKAIKPLVLIRNNTLYRTLSEWTGAFFVLKKRYEFKIKDEKHPVRLRGIAMLSENQIVVADFKNWNLKLYQSVKLRKTISLKHEPRGIAGVSNMEVAVTFAYEKQIAIIDVEKEKWKVFDMETVGKPFSIAYHEKHLAVEFEEGEDGFIALLNMKGKVLRRTKNNENLGFFTGNTIRLALDMTAKCFYVSAMGKQEISCIHFSSNIVWKVKAPSPRGIIVHRRTEKQENTIVFASKKYNALYQLNTETCKKSTIEVNDTLSRPRYIANHHGSQSNFMVVALEDNIIGVFEISAK